MGGSTANVRRSGTRRPEESPLAMTRATTMNNLYVPDGAKFRLAQPKETHRWMKS